MTTGSQAKQTLSGRGRRLRLWWIRSLIVVRRLLAPCLTFSQGVR